MEDRIRILGSRDEFAARAKAMKGLQADLEQQNLVLTTRAAALGERSQALDARETDILKRLAPLTEREAAAEAKIAAQALKAKQESLSAWLSAIAQEK